VAIGVALDTNAYSDYMRGVAARVEVVSRAEFIYLPLIVLAELRAGFAAGSQGSSNESALEQFMASPRVLLLLPDDSTTLHYARIFVELKLRGCPIPTNDLWIAALAAQHNLPLCTSDGHFKLIKQITTC